MKSLMKHYQRLLNPLLRVFWPWQLESVRCLSGCLKILHFDNIFKALATEFSDEESGEKGGEESAEELSRRFLKVEKLCDLLEVSLQSVQRAQKTEKTTMMMMNMYLLHSS